MERYKLILKQEIHKCWLVRLRKEEIEKFKGLLKLLHNGSLPFCD